MIEGAVSVRDLLEMGRTALGGKEPDYLEAEMLLGAALGVGREWLLAHDDEIHDRETRVKYGAMLKERAIEGCPIAYLTGYSEFAGLKLRQARGVFIPRPETEGLVELAVDWINDNLRDFPGCVVADPGCGSGAIGVAVAALTGCRVLATDISGEAVALTGANAAICGVGNLVAPLAGTWLAPLEGVTRRGKVFAVVSNPPYVPLGVISGLAREVAFFEPHAALDGGVDGLECIRAVEAGAREWLAPGGLMAFEIGEDQGEAVLSLMSAAGWERGHIERDLAGKIRYAMAQKPAIGMPMGYPLRAEAIVGRVQKRR